MRMAAVDDLRRHHQVAEGGVDAGADDGLVDLDPGDLRHPLDVPRRGRAGDQRLDPGQVDLVLLVVVAAGVGGQLPPGVAAPLGRQVGAGAVVGGEDAGGGAEFGPHVADGFAVGGREGRHSRPVVFDDLADAPLDVVAAQHLEDHVLGADPVGELPGELDAENLRAGEMIGVAGHGHGDIEAAGADGQHRHPRGAGGVAVRADHGQPGTAEALHMNLVGDAVARPRKVDAVAGTGGLQVLVVVGVLVVGLQQVVVDVLGGETDLDPRQAQRFELQHRHGAGGVLQQGMVDLDGDLLAGDQLPLDEVRLENFLGEVSGHGPLSLSLRVNYHCSKREEGVGSGAPRPYQDTLEPGAY